MHHLPFISLGLLFLTATVNAGEADTSRAVQHLEKARQFSLLAQRDSALAHYQKASEHLEQSGSWALYVQALNGIGESYFYLSQYDAALPYWEAALSAGRQQLGDAHPAVARAWHHLAWYYRKIGNYDKAIIYSQKALAIQRNALGESHPDIALSHKNIGWSYGGEAHYDLQLSHFEKALAIQLEALGEEHGEVARTYNDIGFVHWKRGDYDQQLFYAEKAMNTRIKALGKDHPDMAESYNDVGFTYGLQGDYDKQLVYGRKAEEVLKQAFGDKHSALAVIYNNMGIAHGRKKDYDKQLLYCQKALGIRLEVLGEKHATVARSYHNIARCYSQKGEAEKERLFHQKALELRIGIFGDKHPEVAESYRAFGDLEKKKRNYREALSYYQQAVLALASDFYTDDVYENPPLEAVISKPYLLSALHSKAQTLEKLYQNTLDIRHLNASLAAYETTVALIDAMRLDYKTESTKFFYSKQAMPIYEATIKTACTLFRSTGDSIYIDKAFLVAEKSKAVLLLQLLQEAKAKKIAGIPDRLLDKEKTIKITQVHSARELAKEQEKGTLADSLKVAQLKNKLFDLSAEYRALIALLEAEYPRYYDLKYNLTTIGIQELQQQLPDRATALIEYFIGDSTLYIFGIKSGSYTVAEVAIDASFERSVDDLRGVLCTMGFIRQPEEAYRVFTTNAHQLYQQLIQPVAAFVGAADAEVTRLIIIPDGILGYLPFDMLLTRASESKAINYPGLEYLLKKYEISYGYSSTLLSNLWNKEREAVNGEYIGFAPSFDDQSRRSETPGPEDTLWGTLSQLDNSHTEVQYILQWMSGVPFYEGEATEHNFKKETVNYGIIHLATHTLLDDHHPMYSKLLFSTANDTVEDGYLHTYELYNMRLNAQLAVLSGCNTGYGKMAKGEGIMSLARGFIHAGCQSIVMSLWKVNDYSTSEIMGGFYEGMAAGKSKVDALRQAKLTYLSNTDAARSHPFYWAGFILIGDTSPLELEDSHSYAFLAVIIAIALTLFFLRRKRYTLKRV